MLTVQINQTFMSRMRGWKLSTVVFIICKLICCIRTMTMRDIWSIQMNDVADRAEVAPRGRPCFLRRDCRSALFGRLLRSLMYAKPGSRLLLNPRALLCGFPLNGAALQVMPLFGVWEGLARCVWSNVLGAASKWGLVIEWGGGVELLCGHIKMIFLIFIFVCGVKSVLPHWVREHICANSQISCSSRRAAMVPGFWVNVGVDRTVREKK